MKANCDWQKNDERKMRTMDNGNRTVYRNADVLTAFARELDGRAYGRELTAEDKACAKELGIVVAYGASDDLCELEGALCDEIDCYNGGTAHLSQNGVLEEIVRLKCPCDVTEDCPLAQQVVKQGNLLQIYWCAEDADGFAWDYKIDVPSVAFRIFDHGVKYCRGIVFFKDDLRAVR